jgi:hypothetical protein
MLIVLPLYLSPAAFAQSADAQQSCSDWPSAQSGSGFCSLSALKYLSSETWTPEVETWLGRTPLNVHVLCWPGLNTIEFF